jgi:hypothetical protein
MTEKTSPKKHPEKSAIPPNAEQLPGQDLKQARGMNRNVGHSPNEAGTDQRVEDAKRERHNTRH